jgi:hypothetical protein
MTLPRGTAAGAALLAFVLVPLLLAAKQPPVAGGRVLEVELQTSAGTFAQVFWNDGAGFSDARSSRAPLARTPGGYQVVRLALPDTEVQALRFDPTDAPGEFAIRRMLVRDSSGTSIGELSSGSLLPINHVASMVRDGTITRIATFPNGSDPAFLVTVACLDVRSAWYDLSSVTPLSLALTALLTLVVVGASMCVVGRELLASRTSLEQSRLRRGVLWMVALVGLTISAKLYLLHLSPAPVPWVDQWGAEAGKLYVPFAEGCLSWQQMFSLHNEHRVFFTRIMALALLALNSQWDPQLQQVVNATVHALTGALLAAMLYLTNERRRLDLAVLSCALVFAVPFAWENVMSGFQSAFYLLLLLTILALWLTLRFTSGTLPWALGWICAMGSLATSAGGIATVGVIAVATIAKHLLLRQPSSRLLANLFPAAGLLAIAIGTAPPLDEHSTLRAATWPDLITSLGRNLSWPWVTQPELAFLLWAPVIVLVTIRLLRRHAAAAGREWWMYGLGSWVILNAALLAFGRGADGAIPASRYMDFLSIGALVNLGAVAALLGLLPRPRVGRLAAQVCLSAWVVFLVVGVDRVTQLTGVNRLGVSVWVSHYVMNLRHFMATDDVATLVTKKFPSELPYYDPLQMANAWLRHPYIRQILPPEIRQPLALRPARITNEAFERNGFFPTTPLDPLRPAWGSFTARQNPSQGRFESAFITDCTRPLLRFDVAGYLTTPGLSLVTQDFATARETRLETRDLAREQWTSVFIRCDGPFRVIATDASPEFWFAFRDPIEYGSGSRIAKQLVDQSRDLLLFFAALTLLATHVGWERERSPEAQHPPTA